MEDILVIEHLSKTFDIYNLDKHMEVLKNISISVKKGEFVGITGKSGSGKSTVFKCIYRTYKPQQGKIWYQSEKFGSVDLAAITERQMIFLRQKEIGYVSQFLNVMPRTTARELVRQAVIEMGHGENFAEEETRKILNHFELDRELWDSYPATFSGGEKLRLNIARAMVKHPRLLLLDEPTASLDNVSKLKVRALIEQLISEGATMMGIFHDIEFMENLCTREYQMSEGRLQLTKDLPSPYRNLT